MFTYEDTARIPILDPFCNAHFESLTVNEAMFNKCLDKLKDESATGPDKITPHVLKELGDFVSFPLCMIFSKSLSTGEVPNDWKIVHVIPVFKKGNRCLAENYRPISLTSIVCKILESFIYRAIVNYLSEHRLLNASRHGFVSKRSCLNNLLEYLETLTSLLNKGHTCVLLGLIKGI